MVKQVRYSEREINHFEGDILDVNKNMLSWSYLF